MGFEQSDLVADNKLLAAPAACLLRLLSSHCQLPVAKGRKELPMLLTTLIPTPQVSGGLLQPQASDGC